MSMETEQLVVMLEGKVKDFEKAFQRAERQGTKTYTTLQTGSRKATAQMEADMARGSARVNTALAGMSMQAGVFGKAFLAGLAGGAIAVVLGGITSDIRGTIGAVADLADEAARIGMGAEELQGLQYGMKMAGVETADASAALEKFTDMVGEAAAGEGKLLEIFEANGVALRDVQGGLRPTNELLREFADIIERTPDAAARMNLVTDAFGRGGKQMVLAMEGGSQGLDDMVTDARAAGAVLDEELVAKAAVLDDQFDALTIRVGTFFKEVILGAADAGAAIDGMLKSVLVSDERLKTALGGYDPESIFGADLAQALLADAEAMAQATEFVATYGAALRVSQDQATDFADAIWESVGALHEAGQTEAAETMRRLAVEVGNAGRAFVQGEIDGAQYQALLAGLAKQALDTTAELGAIEGADFSGVEGSARMFAAALGVMRDNAAAALANIRALAGMSVSAEGGATGGAGGSASGSAVIDFADLSPPSGGSAGGGGGGGSASTREIDALIADLQTEQELLTEWYAESLELLNGATDAQLEALGGRHEAMERLEREHQERMGDIQEAGAGDALANAETLFGALATVTAQGNDKMQRISRAAAAAEALINTYRAQAQVLADPTLGFWAKLPAVAAIGAAGMGLVSALGGSGQTVAPSSGSTGTTPPPEATAPAQANLVVTIQGLQPDALYTGAQIQELTDALLDEFGNRGLQVGFQ